MRHAVNEHVIQLITQLRKEQKLKKGASLWNLKLENCYADSKIVSLERRKVVKYIKSLKKDFD